MAIGLSALLVMGGAGSARGAVLDAQALLDAQHFWDNRDWDWYKENIPFFECPDPDIVTTYYYRCELLTKHLTYGSPNSGYSFTEFIDRPFWSGAYGAISCPAGHQIYEARWLRHPRYARDYARYWFRTPGAEPRKYSTWIADALWALHQVHPDPEFIRDLLPDLVANFQGWEERHWVPETGMFWQIGHDDGMELNINSRQTQDLVRGGPGFRPSFNAYLWADARAIAQMATLAGDTNTAQSYLNKAASLKDKVQQRLWDPRREFFFPMAQNNERDKDGFEVQAGALTHQTGRYAGSSYGREEIGFVPWQFNLPDPGFEAAWKFLMDTNYFFAAFGPTTVERHDPMFLLEPTCCWWSGQSWPYATTQTLKALANLLHNYQQPFVTRTDYFKLLLTYTRTHRKEGRPYLAEAAHPDTGSFKGHDSDNHSEHYFHSGYLDLIITGLVGIKPRPDAFLELDPLAPPDWPYFALQDLPYHGFGLGIFWDRDGSRYGRGAGLRVVVDGQVIVSQPTLAKVLAKLPVQTHPTSKPHNIVRINFAVNNDGEYYPRLTSSFSGNNATLSVIQDGNYWYHPHPPNRWTCVGSTHSSDWVAVDLGVVRLVDEVKLYCLEDATDVRAPAQIEVEAWDGAAWKAVLQPKHIPSTPTGHRANQVRFAPVGTQKVRVIMEHSQAGRTGLSEFEVWGDGALPYTPPAPPAGNLALNRAGEGFPKASASFTDRYGGKPMAALDGKIVFRPSPMNRWTSYGSTNTTDWLEVDLGSMHDVSRVDVHLYDDRGGVQPPADYSVEYWDDNAWRAAAAQTKEPALPTGGMVNSIRFSPAQTTKVRVVFVHRGNARSGVTELEVWKE